MFNIANTLVFVGFAPLFARAAVRLVPDRPLDDALAIQAKYLDDELLSTPSLALDRIRMEILHLGEQVRAMLTAVLPAVLTGSAEDLRQLEQMEATNDLEQIGDIMETNLVALGFQRIDRQVTISDATQAVITEFHAEVAQAFDLALQAITLQDISAAQRVVDMKRSVNRLMGSAAVHEAKRLVAEEPNRLEAYTIEMDMLENLKRVFYFCKRMARVVVPSKLLADSV